MSLIVLTPLARVVHGLVRQVGRGAVARLGGEVVVGGVGWEHSVVGQGDGVIVPSIRILRIIMSWIMIAWAWPKIADGRIMIASLCILLS